MTEDMHRGRGATVKAGVRNTDDVDPGQAAYDGKRWVYAKFSSNPTACGG